MQMHHDEIRGLVEATDDAKRGVLKRAELGD